MWIPFALLSALIWSGTRIYEKRLTGTFGNFTLGFAIKVFAILPILAFVFLLPGSREIASLPWDFWLPLLIIWFILYPIQTYLLFRAIREGEISTVTPVMALLPVFNVVTSFFLLGEIPSMIGFLGIVLIVWGTYFMLKNKSEPGVKNNFSLPVLLMLGCVFSMAAGSSLDK